MKKPLRIGGLSEFTTPEVKCERSDVPFVLFLAARGYGFGNCFIGVSFKPGERRTDNFFGVAVKLDDKVRQQGEGMTTTDTEKPFDGQGIRSIQRDQTARVAPMPVQVSGTATDLTAPGLGDVPFLKAGKIIFDFLLDEQYFTTSKKLRATLRHDNNLTPQRQNGSQRRLRTINDIFTDFLNNNGSMTQHITKLNTLRRYWLRKKGIQALSHQ